MYLSCYGNGKKEFFLKFSQTLGDKSFNMDLKTVTHGKTI